MKPGPGWFTVSCYGEYDLKVRDTLTALEGAIQDLETRHLVLTRRALKEKPSGGSK